MDRRGALVQPVAASPPAPEGRGDAAQQVGGSPSEKGADTNRAASKRDVEELGAGGKRGLCGTVRQAVQTVVGWQNPDLRAARTMRTFMRRASPEQRDEFSAERERAAA